MTVLTAVERQWRVLICLLSRRTGLTLKELATDAEVDTRTVRRDLDTFRRLGFVFEERVTERGCKHWRVVDAPAQIPIRFSWPEAVSLYLGRRMLDPLAGTDFWRSAQTAFGKIKAMLGEDAIHQLNKISRSFVQTIVGRSDYADKSELIDRLLMAIEDRRITFVTYQSERATEPVSLEMYPYGFIYHHGSLYLVAFSRDHDSVRHFKIDRVSDVDVQKLTFSPPTDFNLDQHLTHSFGVFHGDGVPQLIRIQFTKNAARYVQEKLWHPSQKLTRKRDGSVILEVKLDHTTEIKAWILGFGPKATVLEPKELRLEVLENLTEMIATYRQSSNRSREQRADD